MYSAQHENGSVTAFVIVVCSIFLLCTGLVVDGSRVVGAKSEALDLAGNAARVGAQQLRSIRSGRNELHVARAEFAARKYLRAQGASGQVRCDGTSVFVTVTANVRMTILNIIGVQSKRITATQIAMPVDQ